MTALHRHTPSRARWIIARSGRRHGIDVAFKTSARRHDAAKAAGVRRPRLIDSMWRGMPDDRVLL